MADIPLLNGFTVSSNYRPYMKARRLSMRVNGLRPSANMYVFFNGVNVSGRCRPVIIPDGSSYANDLAWTSYGAIGTQLTSDATGQCAFYLYVPPQTFYIGSNTIIVQDAVDSTYTSKAEVVYNAMNFPQTADNSNDTRLVQIDATSSDQSQDITNRTNPVAVTTYNNPFSQTFTITSALARNNDGIFVPQLDLNFTKKDPVFGVTVELHEVQAGVPSTSSVVAMSRVYLPSSQINVGTPTQIIFPGLVFLLAGKDYAISLIPDSAGQNFAVATAKVGEYDKTTVQPISKTWGNGQLFLPSNGGTWTGIDDEFLQFTLYYSLFTANSGFITLTNKNYEFLTVSNTSGTWIPGEHVVQVANTNLGGTVTTVPGSFVLQGSGTSFTTQYLANGFITIVHSATDVEVLKIKSVATDTALNLYQAPIVSNVVAGHQNSPVGMMEGYNPASNSVHLIASTAANSSFVFAPNGVIIGSDSSASAKIVTVDDRPFSKGQVITSMNSVAGTNITVTGKVMGADHTIPAAGDAWSISGSNKVNTRSGIIASRSNEVLYAAGGKSLTMNIAFTTSSNTLSPVVDLAIPALMGYGNRVNANTTNENTRGGAALSKYVSQTVTLATGMDAEDMSLWISAWRPPGTDVAVFAKILNASDPDQFVDKDWTQLTPVSGASAYSDALVETDFVELQFTFPTNPPGTTQVGVLTTANNSANVSGIGTNFTSLVNPGDIIRLFSGGNSKVSKVLSVANTTSMTLTSNATFSSTTAQYQTINTQHTAFKEASSTTVRYFNSTGQAYDMYKYFAIKLDLLSNYSYIAPTVDNLRVVAVS